MKNHFQSVLLLILLGTGAVRSQIAGSFTVPGSFPTIAAAINTLNTLGVAGPVTINVVAAHTETVPFGGLQLFTPPGSSAANYVIFQKQGAGANPLLTAYAGGTANIGSNHAVLDGIWAFIGADYITVDGIDLSDPYTTNPTCMEYGFGFFRQSSTNGCQNNTIKNCSITMQQRIAHSILVAASSYTAQHQILATTSAAGSNSFNKFYSNTIAHCYKGIALMGVPNTNSDQANDVGGALAATGNTITHFGAISSGFGVFVADQYSINISNNVLSNVNGSSNNNWVDVLAIQTGTAPGTNVTIRNNTITLFAQNTSTLSRLHGIWNEAGDAPASASNTVDISGNVFPSYNFSTATGNVLFNHYLIISQGQAARCIMNNNYASNIQIGGGSVNCFYGNATGSITANNNTVTNVSQSSGFISGVSAYAYNITAQNNLLSNMTINDNMGGRIFAMATGNYTMASVSGNTVTNVTSYSKSGIYAEASGISAAYANIANNVISYLSTPATSGTNFSFYNHGISLLGIGGSPIGSATITGNTIYSLTANGVQWNAPGLMTGITFTTNNAIVTRNKIYGLHSNTDIRIVGIQQGTMLGSGISNAQVSNNIIGDIAATASNQSLSAVAFSTVPQCNASIVYNSIMMDNAMNSGTNSGSAVLYLEAGGIYNLNNNILINTSASAGSGGTTIIRTNTTSLSHITTTSNRNLLYIGPPQLNKGFFHNGTTSYSTFASYQSLMAPREALSVIELPPFATTLGAAPNTLSLSPLVPTQAEGGAAPFAGVTVDYAGQARNTVTPDIGAWEGAYTQADKLAPAILSQGFTGPPCNLTSRTLTVALSDASGIATGSVAPRLYYRVNFGLYTSVQGVLSSGTPSNGVWDFNLSYSASLNDVIYYFLAIQDQSNFNNLTLQPSTGASGTDVNNVSVPPNPASNYTLQTFPTISVNNGTVCSGQSYTLSPSGGGTYTYSGGSAVVSPASTTSYTITGASSMGCPATNTVVATVSVLASPTITVNSGSVCLGSPFVLVPTGATSYTMSSGTATAFPTTSTSYLVVGTNSTGCLSNQAVANVTVVPSSIGATASSTSICKDATVTLQATAANSFTWSGGIANNNPFSPAATAIYSVTGVGTNGCTGTATITVVVNYKPGTTAVASSSTICAGESVTLTAANATGYTWLHNNATQSQITESPVATTTYSVKGNNAQGCDSTVAVLVVVDACTGLVDVERKIGFSFYPNPADRTITITCGSEFNDAIVRILDVSGRLVKEYKPESSTANLAMPDEQGVYFVELYSGQRLIFSGKVIRE